MDADGDGRISSSEWQKAPGRFQQIDSNKDGYITVQEIEAFRQGGSANTKPAAENTASERVSSSPAGNVANDGWIDVHFHLVSDAGDLAGFEQAAQKAIGIMDAKGIAKIVVMSPPRPHPNFDVESIGNLSKKYPSRIAILGGGGTLNPMIQKYGHATDVPQTIRDEFRNKANEMVANGARGFGEIAAHHVSLSPSHGYESVPADSPLLLLLADIAAGHGVPIDLHFDPVPKKAKKPADLRSPKNPPVFEENVSSLERLLDHNRKTIIVWAHAGSDPVGWFTPKLAGNMLARHPNLYFSIRPAGKPNNHPAWSKRDGVNSSWVRVFRKYPDRFVIGTDTFIVADTYSGQPHAPLVLQQKTALQRDAVNELLSGLTKDLARQIGRDNAVRIYRLNEQ
jgi:predicted TIM-barrel fold metal-dependent hydrolase